MSGLACWSQERKRDHGEQSLTPGAHTLIGENGRALQIVPKRR